MTNEAKRKVITELLKRYPDRSNRRIAKQAGASHNTVEVVRADLQARGQLTTSETRTDTKGREQPAHKSKPSAPAEHCAADDALQESSAGLDDEALAASRKFTPGETFADITWAIDALVRAIDGTAPEAVIAELDPGSLMQLVCAAGFVKAWLDALATLAEFPAARRRAAGTLAASHCGGDR
jgi:hypothetical protein